jgi:hypothetical protein
LHVAVAAERIAIKLRLGARTLAHRRALVPDGTPDRAIRAANHPGELTAAVELGGGFTKAVAVLAFLASIWAGTARAGGRQVSVTVSENARYVNPFQIDLQVTVSCPAGDFVQVLADVDEGTRIAVGRGLGSPKANMGPDEVFWCFSGPI